MVAPDPRPTAQEIEELIDLVRRDPSSPAFIDLGEAYLALGRPKDAIGIGNLGLEAAPDSLEGRVMLARAYAALHLWKEAQGELLRVVKVDRSSRGGFALLGEVLLRRADFERAVPVLQHAQNLDPTSPQILAMLKRARAGQGLDAPPPIPTPVPPRGEPPVPVAEPPRQRARPPAPASSPPAPFAPPAPAAPPQRAHAPSRPPPIAPPAPMPASQQPGPLSMALNAALPDPDPEPAAPPAPPPRAKKMTAPPPAQAAEPASAVRPRVISGAKVQNAAAASLRQSAAIGETYLNDLLTGGLLDVAGVRVPDSEFDLRPDRRWGRSTRRAFIFLFVILVLGIGGGGGWYWWSEKQRAEAVARLQKEAKDAIGAGDFAGLEVSVTKLRTALDKDPGNPLTFAYVGETTGLEALLYGTDGDRVDAALKAAAAEIKLPTDPGAREIVIGRAAVELSRLDKLSAPATTLGEVEKSLDELLAKSDGDRWARWLKGRALLAAGERKAAISTIKTAADGPDGLVVAMIDQADLEVDDGALDDALALYDKALAKSKDHPLAVVGKSLARAEASVQASDAMDDLNVKLDKNLGSRVNAYRNLALAFALSGLEDYPGATAALAKATAQHPPGEPRFWSRVAWAQYARGDFAAAATSRGKIAWYGKTKTSKAEDDPTVLLVDAGLLLASGRPDSALDTASKIEGVRPRILRAYAQLDLKMPKDALTETEEVLKKAPENLEAQILHEEARMIAGPAKETTDAADALEKLGRKAKSKLGHHALGMAYVALGDTKSAQPQLEQALAEISEESPNPLAYRTRTALAEILLAAGNIDEAGKQLDLSLKANSGYFPTRADQAKLVLQKGDADQALELLQPIVKENGDKISPYIELTLAEALVRRKDSTPKDKDDAKAILTAIKDKIQPPTEVGRVAALIDPKLPAELNVPVPPPGAEPPPGTPPVAPAPGVAPKPPTPPHHHHHG